MRHANTRPPTEWDRHSIKAEIHRRGMTLTGIAKDAGLMESACRRALMGLDRKGADAIAAALDIPFDDLFPADMFVRSRRHANHNGSDRSPERQKRGSAADKTRAHS